MESLRSITLAFAPGTAHGSPNDRCNLHRRCSCGLHPHRVPRAAELLPCNRPFHTQLGGVRRRQNSAASMFLAGTLDGLNLVTPPTPQSMRSNLTDLRSFVMLEGVGHWPQLEAPDATNAALLAFLKSL
jgi:pimeloyl-ACP methyl ester carboxylesterase